MACQCCGRWRIELVTVDGAGQYRVTHDGSLMSGRQPYPRTVAELVALLRRARGPELADFVECE